MNIIIFVTVHPATRGQVYAWALAEVCNAHEMELSRSVTEQLSSTTNLWRISNVAVAALFLGAGGERIIFRF